MQNPYAAPSADLSTANEQSVRLDIFKRFSTWYVFGLSIITLNLYVLYWMYTRSKILNRLNNVEPIGDNFMSVTIVINVISLPLGYAQPVLQEYGDYALIPDIVAVVSAILLLVWAFKFRHRLNDFLEEHQTPHQKAGPVFTFLFQVLHLSYKINENLDLLQQAVEHQDQQEDEQAENQAETLIPDSNPVLEPDGSKA